MFIIRRECVRQLPGARGPKLDAMCGYQVIERREAGEQVVGHCHITRSGRRDEFGGFYFDPEAENFGITVALGRCAIANHYFYDPPVELIAHVPEVKEYLGQVLSQHLGFVAVAQTEGNGKVFRLPARALTDYADWIDSFPGTLQGSYGISSALEVEMPAFSDPLRWSAQLRELASGHAVR